MINLSANQKQKGGKDMDEDKYEQAISLLRCAVEYMDNTHGYDTELYAEIEEFLENAYDE